MIVITVSEKNTENKFENRDPEKKEKQIKL